MKLPKFQTGIPDLDEKIAEYVGWEQNESYHNQILQLVKDNEIQKLRDMFLDRLSFGTAGLRGVMGPGYSQMNDVVIIQTGQGLCRYLQQCFPDIQGKGIAIGFDGRYNSKRFAELTTSIFLNQDIKVYLFSQICPTPFVAYSVRHFGCASGIMITASHNPKEDNGYKVYWDNGAQIISPHDKLIQQNIMENLVPWDRSMDTSILSNNPKLIDPLAEVMERYYSELDDLVLYRGINSRTPLKFTYSAMHGVGYHYMEEAFKTVGLQPFIAVQEQKDPDPEFSTVRFPNPEEGKSALDLSFRTANSNNCTIILANDPDADRLAVAEKINEEWKVFTGNELGGLLGWWAVHCYRERTQSKDLSDVYMLGSTVSSKLLMTMAKAENFNFIETLTGFKWMGNRACELMAQGKTVLFAFEEAIGFMFGTTVLDKDGISAGARIAELAAYLHEQGLTLSDKLNEIYKTYGQHISENSYFICYKQDVIRKIFDRLRNFDGAYCTYPVDILNGLYKVTAVRDLTTGYDSSQPDNEAVLPVSSSSQMVTFTFENGLVITLRTSGTEPKIKYYSELCADPSQSNVEVLHSTLHEMVTAIVEEYLQPTQNGLIPRSS